MEYEVRWKIDIEAENEIDATQQALEIMRDPHSIATVFQVRIKDSKKKFKMKSLICYVNITKVL